MCFPIVINYSIAKQKKTWECFTFILTFNSHQHQWQLTPITLYNLRLKIWCTLMLIYGHSLDTGLSLNNVVLTLNKTWLGTAFLDEAWLSDMVSRTNKDVDMKTCSCSSSNWLKTTFWDKLTKKTNKQTKTLTQTIIEVWNHISLINWLKSFKWK